MPPPPPPPPVLSSPLFNKTFQTPLFLSILTKATNPAHPLWRGFELFPHDVSGDLRVENLENVVIKWWISDEWNCLFGNDPKLVFGQPPGIYKKTNSEENVYDEVFLQ